jgi:hypothetical protein
MFELNDKVILKFTKIKGYIDAIPGDGRYRVKTKDGYKWCYEYELESLNKHTQQLSEEEKPIKTQKTKTDLRYLG